MQITSRAPLVLLAFVAASVAGWAQSAPPPVEASSTPWVFDTVSIHQNKSGTMSYGFRSPANGVVITNAPLNSFFGIAFKGLRSSKYISGLPDWANSTRFDIQAKIDDEKVAAFKSLPPEQGRDARQAMMQQLFIDRFKLKFHLEKKEFPAYALVVAKGGSKLKEADPDRLKNPGPDYHPGRLSGRATEITGQAVTMADLVRTLSRGTTDREVLDQTGLIGKYDIALKWPAVVESNGDTPATADDARDELFRALQDQLGLKLEASHDPIVVDVVVVDHLEMPSEN